MLINIELIKSYKKWQNYKLINRSLIKEITAHTLSRFNSFACLKQAELSVLLTGDEEIRLLNKQFRNIDQATNVLSFPNKEFRWQDLECNGNNVYEFSVEGNYLYLGDIAFSYQMVCDESEKQEKKFEYHFIHLLVHGILHLIGFDHQYEEEANVMENIEIEILKDFHIPSPY